ncbi:PAS domain S-box protein [Halomicroarcula sp. GCM10025709]|uniref:PAS domain S-box protein n=1 Tax=Haloarcula TaxID=2237 RepID=UPI0024C361CB|nr:PAS domain S-box protein [Halomicroarcula sp. YJ-61-S]
MQAGFEGLLYAVAVVSLGVATLAWVRRDAPGGTPMVVFHVALAVGAVAYARELAAVTVATQAFWVRLWLPAQTVVAVSWLYAALQYAGSTRFTTRRVAGLLAVEPVLLSLLLAGERRLVYVPPERGVSGSLLQTAGTDLAVGFLLHSIFLLVVALAGTTVLVRLYLRSRHLYRVQAGAVLVSALAPWAAIVGQALFFDIDVDTSIFAWAVSGAALTLGLSTFKQLDPVPTARKTIVEEMGDGVVVVDNDGIVTDTNRAARDILALGDDLVGQPLASIVERLGDLAVGEAATDGFVERSVTVDGDRRFLEVELSEFTDRFDRSAGRLLLIRDVTERKRREQQFERYKTIFDSVNEPVYVLDGSGRFVLYNGPFEAFVGADGDALVGEPFDRLLADGETTPTADGERRTVELALQTRAGEPRPCEADLAPISFETADSGSVGVLRDVSQRKRIESELVETSERLETLVEASPLAIVAVDRDGVVEVWNPAAADLFGWRAEEVIAERIPVIPDDQADRLADQYDQVLAGERLTNLENVLQRKDGTRVEVSVSIAPIHDADGTVTGSVSIITDITERKARERKLERQNERLDEFADIVSHDLRNPIQVASGHLDLLGDSVPAENRDHLDGALQALERMETIIESTLTLAREGRDIETPEPVAFAAIVERAWASVATDDGTLTVDDVPETVQGDPTRLATLLENLFRNAVEHGSTGNQTESDDSVEHGPTGSRPEADDSVDITVGGLDDGFYVADDGAGIPETERGSVFDSGYSSEQDNTGFGLAIVQRIAHAHDWSVSVTESEDGGARFEFRGVVEYSE